MQCVNLSGATKYHPSLTHQSIRIGVRNKWSAVVALHVDRCEEKWGVLCFVKAHVETATEKATSKSALTKCLCKLDGAGRVVGNVLIGVDGTCI